MKVELLYLASETEKFHQYYDVADGLTLEQLILQSQLLFQYPNLALETLKCGIFSKQVSLQHKLQAGDRVEIYRQLTISPMEKRRILAERKK